MQNGRCKSNPARLVKRLPEENERTRFLSEEEEERLRQLIERDCPEHLPELDIALHCGMRQGEQYNLLWPDVDLDGPRAKLRKTKNKSTRYAPLNAVAREALHQLLENISLLMWWATMVYRFVQVILFIQHMVVLISHGSDAILLVQTKTTSLSMSQMHHVLRRQLLLRCKPQPRHLRLQ